MIFCRAGDTGTSDWAKTTGTATRAAVIREQNMVEGECRRGRSAGPDGRGAGLVGDL